VTISISDSSGVVFGGEIRSASFEMKDGVVDITPHLMASYFTNFGDGILKVQKNMQTLFFHLHEGRACLKGEEIVIVAKTVEKITKPQSK